MGIVPVPRVAGLHQGPVAGNVFLPPHRGGAVEALARQELAAARQELDAIKRSRSWKVARMLSKAAAAWR